MGKKISIRLSDKEIEKIEGLIESNEKISNYTEAIKFMMAEYQESNFEKILAKLNILAKEQTVRAIENKLMMKELAPMMGEGDILEKEAEARKKFDEMMKTKQVNEHFGRKHKTLI